MNKTDIEYLDYTWNPITGCSKCSPGCANCWAERMSKRLKGRYGYHPLRFYHQTSGLCCDCGYWERKTPEISMIDRIRELFDRGLLVWLPQSDLHRELEVFRQKNCRDVDKYFLATVRLTEVTQRQNNKNKTLG